MEVGTHLRDLGWEEVACLGIEGRDPRYRELNPALVGPSVARFADRLHPRGLYLHQAEAVSRYAQGHHVCLATGTASGKTTLFHCAALAEFERDPDAKVVCLYPLKALAAEQAQRWRHAMGLAVRDCRVNTISGDVPVAKRAGVLRRSHVAVVTPDVMHAWMLPSVGEPAVRRFLQCLRLVVVDEAHAYTGVFGSNAGFLFRRLRHVCSLLGSMPRFVAASATIASPEQHLRLLTGLDFEVVGPEYDGARRYPKSIRFVNPPASEDLLTSLAQMMHVLVTAQTGRFIAFVDSRKQVELITSITVRGQSDPAEHHDHVSPTDSEPDDEITQTEDARSFMRRLDVLPYRSGYEDTDRAFIQSRLSDGSLRGVISTSALELGIDIPGLDTAVLVGVPSSSTSLHQRIGRVGRHAPGTVYVVNAGTIYDEDVFGDPPAMLRRPPAEGALYLENTRLQYIHALCLARLGGEHDLASGAGLDDVGLDTSVEWPAGFLDLCRGERVGQVPSELQSLKQEAGDNPNHAFPLRDVESSFRLVFRQGPEEYPLGSMSYAQCLREAYPGAVYRYATRPYRVYKVGLRDKTIWLRPERAYVTRPNMLPPLVFPNLRDGNVFQDVRLGTLRALECNLQVREWLGGFTERRGSVETAVSYPHHGGRGSFYFPHPHFFRNYFTSGIVILHPLLDREGVAREVLANLLFEAFLLIVPFERSDVRSGNDRLRAPALGIPSGSRFVSVFDSTYGSLHLSGKLLDELVLRPALKELPRLARQLDVDQITRDAAEYLADTAASELLRSSLAIRRADETVDGTSVEVVLPGSEALLASHCNAVFEVTGVYWHPMENCLYYRGKAAAIAGTDNTLRVPAHCVLPVVGMSKMGRYCLETGELVADSALE